MQDHAAYLRENAEIAEEAARAYDQAGKLGDDRIAAQQRAHAVALRAGAEALALWRQFLNNYDDVETAESLWTSEAARLRAQERLAEARALIGAA